MVLHLLPPETRKRRSQRRLLLGVRIDTIIVFCTRSSVTKIVDHKNTSALPYPWPLGQHALSIRRKRHRMCYVTRKNLSAFGKHSSRDWQVRPIRLTRQDDCSSVAGFLLISPWVNLEHHSAAVTFCIICIVSIEKKHYILYLHMFLIFTQ